MQGGEIARNESTAREVRYYYTCWPFPMGGWVCGVSLVAIGAGLFLQAMFPGWEELVWGSVLIGLGVVVLLAAASQRSRLPNG